MAKILIVDDSEMLRSELKEALQGGGHEVVEGCDGLDGLGKAKESEGIELIITDFNMPELNGLAMVEKIREIEYYKTIPVFVLTTETSPELKAHATRVGVMAWIIKPFVAEKVNLGISKVLAKMKK